jgi:hypothetical protein
MTDEIVWEDPPVNVAGRKGVWIERLAPLRDRPGEWAKFPDTNAGLAHNIKSGRLVGVEAGEFETRAIRQGKSGKCDVYVRFVGKADLKAVGR